MLSLMFSIKLVAQLKHLEWNLMNIQCRYHRYINKYTGSSICTYNVWPCIKVSQLTSVICYQCSCSNVNNHVISYSLQDLVRIFDTVWNIRYNIYANMNRLYVYYKYNVSKYGIGWFGQQLLLIIYINNIFYLINRIDSLFENDC